MNIFSDRHKEVYEHMGWPERSAEKTLYCPSCLNTYSEDALCFADDPAGKICNGCFRGEEAKKISSAEMASKPEPDEPETPCVLGKTHAFAYKGDRCAWCGHQVSEVSPEKQEGTPF